MTGSAGTTVNSYAYTAWGEAIAALTSESIANYFRWVGMLGYFFDDEADTYYVRTRHYDPGTGRWVSQDPLGYDAAGFNLFGYVGNNPLNRTDPNGRGWQFPAAGGGVLLLGFLAICCVKHVTEIAAATNKKVEQIQAGWPPGYSTLAEGSPADAMQHCIGACEAYQNPGPCLSSSFVRRSIDGNENPNTNDGASDLKNNQIGYGITGDCQKGCLAALKAGKLSCFDKIVLFPCLPPP